MAEEVILKTGDVSVRVMHLAAQESTAWHHHSVVDDYFVCLKGCLRVETRDGAPPEVLAPGETCRIVAGRVHRAGNGGNSPAEYLLVQGVGPYDFIREG